MAQRGHRCQHASVDQVPAVIEDVHVAPQLPNLHAMIDFSKGEAGRAGPGRAVSEWLIGAAIYRPIAARAYFFCARGAVQSGTPTLASPGGLVDTFESGHPTTHHKVTP